jgi:DNA replication licensing factor MCM5
MHRRCTNSNPRKNNTEARISADAAQNANVTKLEVDIAHIGEYDASMLGFLLSQPARILPALEKAATDALESLLYDLRRNEEDTTTQNEVNNQENNPEGNNQETNANTAPSIEELLTGISIQILLRGNLKPTNLRSVKSEHINRLLKCPGIVISTSPVKNRAVQLKCRCTNCNNERTVYATDGPFGSVTLPANCPGGDAAGDGRACPRFPFSVVPDESRFVDQQTLKLQEAPERVPTGEMPRSVLLAVERSLVDVAPPGTRVSVFCIPTMFTTGGFNNQNPTKSVYLRVVGMVRDNDAHGQSVTFTPAEEEAFRTLARRADVYNILYRSIAPDISGSYTVDIKKALVCQLFSGSRKKLPDGVRLRGDINVLLLGDPSMAKSQFLKFISKVAPIGIYTSGKGSSAAGLTASVVKNARGEFYLEGGAMVLADGGIVCIDEFDKMRPQDRVAIHEAMEQQTISIAKAGITTVLNSRSSVLAAANPVFGRYDDFKSASENIDLMTTILSRFDLIFLVRDIREESIDRMICQHVMGVHINSSASSAVGRNSHGAGLGQQSGGDAAFSYIAATNGGNMPGDTEQDENG